MPRGRQATRRGGNRGCRRRRRTGAVSGSLAPRAGGRRDRANGHFPGGQHRGYAGRGGVRRPIDCDEQVSRSCFRQRGTGNRSLRPGRRGRFVPVAEGLAACDGASVAAPHVAALAALIVAHRADFRSDFANRNSSRVDRLFRILMETATPPRRSNANRRRAPRRAARDRAVRREQSAEVAHGLGELRYAMQLAGLAEAGFRLKQIHPPGARIACGGRRRSRRPERGDAARRIIRRPLTALARKPIR